MIRADGKAPCERSQFFAWRGAGGFEPCLGGFGLGKGVQSFPKLPLLAWLTTLIGLLILPNTIGAGGGVGGPGFIGTALLMLLVKGFLLSLKNMTSPFVYFKVLSVDLLGFGLLWGWLVLPSNLAETHFSHDWAVKRQMIKLQTLLETYAVDVGGLYPQNREQLKQQALRGQYWKELDLPSCQPYFLWQGIENQLKGRIPVKRKTFLEGSDPVQACAIRHLPLDNFSGYFIYGYGPEQTRIKDKGLDFFLSNG